MTNINQLIDIIADPIDGPYEGEDFCIDEQGYIQVHESRMAALIMRRANTSGMFSVNLVKMGQRGDSVLLGFDDLIEAEPVYISKIGYQKSVIVEVKKDSNGKFCVYLDKKRSARLFNKLASAKTFIKRLDKELETVGNTVANYEESED